MSKKTNKRRNQTALVEALSDQVVRLRVYYVRIHDESNRLTLTMKFNNYYYVRLDESRRICHTNSLNPFIYTFDLDVRMHKGKLYLHCEDGWKELDEYRLEISYPGTVYGQFKFEEIGNQRHSLKEYYDMQHCFLFGIRFGPRFHITLPGKMNRRASDENEQRNFFRN